MAALLRAQDRKRIPRPGSLAVLCPAHLNDLAIRRSSSAQTHDFRTCRSAGDESAQDDEAQGKGIAASRISSRVAHQGRFFFGRCCLAEANGLTDISFVSGRELQQLLCLMDW
jgi:hypothetical protein